MAGSRYRRIMKLLLAAFAFYDLPPQHDCDNNVLLLRSQIGFGFIGSTTFWKSEHLTLSLLAVRVRLNYRNRDIKCEITIDILRFSVLQSWS